MREAREYAGLDELRKRAMEQMNESQTLLAKTEQAMKDAGKSLEKASKKQLKSHCADVRKALGKIRLDKVTEAEVTALRDATMLLKTSAESILHMES